jgi:hypothetical protein
MEHPFFEVISIDKRVAMLFVGGPAVCHTERLLGHCTSVETRDEFY